MLAGIDMADVLAVIAIPAFVAAWVTGIVAWFASVIYAFKAIKRAQPGVSLWSENLMSVLLQSERLTPEGLEYRRKCLIAVRVSVIAIGGPLLLTVMLGQFH
jgi:hypothetical protein